MKKNLIAEITSLPDTLRSTARIAKCALATAGAIAIIGVTAALSNDSGRNKSAFFIDNGIVFVGDLARGINFERVEKAYPIHSTGANGSGNDAASLSTEPATDSTDNEIE